VALPVVRDFIAHVKTRALGRDVIGSLTPGQALVQVVYEELAVLMGTTQEGLNLATTRRHHSHGRLAGCWQNHDLRQAGALAERAKKESPARKR